ncbi:MAG: hypothetical protein WCB12_17515 [Bryobacteraceae bacterium]
MNRSGLKFLAILLMVSIGVVLTAGLDNLPRNLRQQIDSERASLATAQQQVAQANTEVTGEVTSESALFHAIPAAAQWPAGLAQSESQLAEARHEMDELSLLEKQNRRQDREKVESLLAQESGVRVSAAGSATAIQKDAAHWIELKRELPQRLDQMSRDYQAIHTFDLAPVTAVVAKGETDWPEKKPDLDARVAGLHGIVTQSDTLWQSSAEERRQAAAGDFAHLDFAALVAAQDSLHNDAADLPRRAEEVKSLDGQLYYNWDKILVDMEVRGIGSARHYDQEIRTVKTHLDDAGAKAGTSTSEEAWVDVSNGTYDAMRNDLGMAIEHKPAGKFDSEAEHVAQPAGFAYMAPPGQVSNQYGYWDHHDGRDFWVFYGQYALMRDLLFNHSYRPIDRYDWEGYRDSWRSGRTYYGRDEAAGAPKYGSQGTVTQDRYAGSNYARSGGFRDSQYASKSGSFRNSPYSGPGGDRSARHFGHGGGGEPRAPSFHPAPRMPRPAFRPPSMPRHFGRH